VTAETIRRLTRADVAAFRALRLEGLRRYPEAFGSSYEEESAYTLTDFERFLPDSPPGGAYGAFVDGALVGIAALIVSPKLKQRHKGDLIAVYVTPAHRHGGLARRLIEAILAAARAGGLLSVRLTVTVGNQAARRLYLGFGFVPYGLERRAVRVDGVFHDDELMALELGQGGSR
jgi:ribosomal protein S18 acetylase RimI-like enzyme